jgi:hypothetical protein
VSKLADREEQARDLEDRLELHRELGYIEYLLVGDKSNISINSIINHTALTPNLHHEFEGGCGSLQQVSQCTQFRTLGTFGLEWDEERAAHQPVSNCQQPHIKRKSNQTYCTLLSLQICFLLSEKNR